VSIIPARRRAGPDNPSPVRRPTARELRRQLDAEMLQELVRIRQTMTEYAGRLGGQIVNNVLETATLAIGADGFVTREYGVAAGAVQVFNLSGANDMTVVAGGPAGYIPPTGTGVSVVPAGKDRVINVAARQITIYGTAGDRVSFQVWTVGARPSVV
jgi:hypothetical protein